MLVIKKQRVDSVLSYVVWRKRDEHDKNVTFLEVFYKFFHYFEINIIETARITKGLANTRRLMYNMYGVSTTVTLQVTSQK